MTLPPYRTTGGMCFWELVYFIKFLLLPKITDNSFSEIKSFSKKICLSNKKEKKLLQLTLSSTDWIRLSIGVDSKFSLFILGFASSVSCNMQHLIKKIMNLSWFRENSKYL